MSSTSPGRTWLRHPMSHSVVLTCATILMYASEVSSNSLGAEQNKTQQPGTLAKAVWDVSGVIKHLFMHCMQ
jgi:hypothetical protein